jgi:UDP-GlcNAc:undecaprenyl-phosphate GlcNAc-1-phosphate transferase
MQELELFVIFVTSLALTFGSIPLIMRFAVAYGLYDHPDINETTAQNIISRRIHTRPIPRLGGLGIVIGFFLSMLLWVSPLPLKTVYTASLLMFGIGIFDDLRPISARSRLLLQVLIVSMVVWYGNLQVNAVRLTGDLQIELPYVIGLLLSIFIIVGSINAINLTDGLDGLAGGIVLIGILLLSMLHFLVTNDALLIICFSVPLVGSLLGFLRYNTHPATIFMGDGGSNWLGFMVGTFIVLVLNGAILSGSESRYEVQWASAAQVPFISALLCLAVPIADTAFVMTTRVLAGKSPMAADKNHFHHMLMKIGLSHPQSVATIYFLAVLIGTMGLMPVAYPQYHLSWAPYLGVLYIIIFVGLCVKINKGTIGQLISIRSPNAAGAKFGPIIRGAIHYMATLNRYLIYGILAVAPVLAGIPHKSIGFAAVAAIALMLVASVTKDSQSFFQSFVISVGASILLTAINFNSLFVEIMGNKYNLQFLYNASFIFLFVSTSVFLFLTLRRNHFITTPTDFLMICLPLGFLFVPEPFKSDFKLNIISLRSLVLFMSIRALTRSHHGFIRRVRTVSIFGLLYVSLAALCGLRIVY